jgi:hypothetical protein
VEPSLQVIISMMNNAPLVITTVQIINQFRLIQPHQEVATTSLDGRINQALILQLVLHLLSQIPVIFYMHNGRRSREQ